MKRNRIVQILIVFIVIIGALNSCKNESTSVQTIPSVNKIVPLSLGNSWVYSKAFYDTAGNIERTTSGSVGVFSDSLINGKLFFSYWTWWCINTDSGLTYLDYYSSNDSSFHYRLLYKYPTIVNEVYTSNTVKIINTDTIINVPAGKFHCVRYQFSNATKPTNEHFVSVNIGLIKSIDYYPEGYPKIISTAELSSYTIK